MLLLSACGFTPLYGGSSAVESHRPDIVISNIPDRSGQQLRNFLIDRIYTQGRPQDARYELRIAPLDITTTGLGILQDGTATRVQIEIAARLSLIERATGKAVLDKRSHAVGGYDVLDEQYATLVTRQSVTDHILAELADNIVRDLDLHFRTSAERAAP